MLIAHYIVSMCLLIASAFDMVTRKIPNWISLVILLSGVGNNYFYDNSMADSSAGLIIGFLLMLPGYVFASMGAGDVKFMAAIGSVAGVDAILNIAFFSYIAILIMAVSFITLKGSLLKLLRRYKTLIFGVFYGALNYQKPDKTDAANCRLPLAPAIALATFYVLYPQLCNSGLMVDLWRYWN